MLFLLCNLQFNLIFSEREKKKKKKKSLWFGRETRLVSMRVISTNTLFFSFIKFGENLMKL